MSAYATQMLQALYTKFFPIHYNDDLDVRIVCKMDVGGEDGYLQDQD